MLRNAWLALILLFTLPNAAYGMAAHSTYSSGGNAQAPRWKVLSFGDSIVAGFCGAMCAQTSYALYYSYLGDPSMRSQNGVEIDGEILATSGNTVQQILSEIEASADSIGSADVITLEACGNDYLAARNQFRKEGGPNYCKPEIVAEALSRCEAGITRIFDRLHQLAKPSVRIRPMTIYYPGVDRDKAKKCNGVSHFETFLKYFAAGNWFTCEEARKSGQPCADVFSEFNALDENRAKIAWIPGESREAYLDRLTREHFDLIVDPSSVKKLLIDDNTHPNQQGHARIGLVHHRLGY